jgi:hypothetical protein
VLEVLDDQKQVEDKKVQVTIKEQITIISKTFLLIQTNLFCFNVIVVMDFNSNCDKEDYEKHVFLYYDKKLAYPSIAELKTCRQNKQNWFTGRSIHVFTTLN